MALGADSGPPETLAAYTTRRIQTAIADGHFPPGSRLSPTMLAVELGSSHIPIREALTSLAARGYIEHRRGRGFFARELHLEDLAEIYHLREILEREALTAAIPKLTDEDLAEMRRLVDLMGDHVGREDRLRYLELNREFHFIPFKRAGSERLLQLITYLWDVAAPYGAVELVESSAGYKQHLEQLALFEARDLDGIIAAMEDHRDVRLRHQVQWEARQHSGAEPD
jgi:DNA-binding GntR family transcriptional regulator